MIADLARLSTLRHSNSFGSLALEATPSAVMIFRSVETDDDAIGMLATALAELLERRAAVEAVVMERLPRGLRGAL